MAEVNEAVLKRIRALLAMSRGNANENEALIAGRKVQEMLAQFNLSLSDVERDDGGKIIEDGELMTSSSNPWRRSLAHAVARLYLSDYYWNHVKVDTPTRRNGYTRLDRHNFIGLPHNVVVAKEMFVYFVDTVERLAKDSRRRTSASNAYEHAFRMGCATRLTNRIWARVNEMMEPPAGLLVKSGLPALYKGMDARIQEHVAGLGLIVKPTGGKHSSWEGVIAGDKAGNSIGLDDQIGGGDKPLALPSA